MEQEQQHHQWVVEEEEEEEEVDEQVEDAALQRRQSLKHRKESIVTSSSSSYSPSPVTNEGGHSSGVCSASLPAVATDPDEPPVPIQKEDEEVSEPQMVNDVENVNHFNDDCAAVGLGLVAEIVGAATNEDATNNITTVSVAASQNNNSVYFDKQQGMWKCHHCAWTKRFDSHWTVPVWNLKGYNDWPMNVKTMIQHGPCFVCETGGNHVNGLNGIQDGDGARTVLLTIHGEGEFDMQVEGSDIQSSPCNEVNSQYMKTVNDKVPSSSELSPLDNSSEVQAATIKNFGDETSAKECPNLTEEIDRQLEELDVEAVLAKQETHDLFCPNCNSCITKRVILKKRKRNIHKLDTKAKRDKLDPVVSSKLVNSSAHEANQVGQAIITSDVGSLEPQPLADTYEPEREPEVFRCLSCFSFFIPNSSMWGNGLNLFWNFRGASQPETLRNPLIEPASNLENSSNIATSNANWFSFLFPKKRGGKAREQGNASLEHSRTGPAEQHHSSSITTNTPNSSEIGHPEGPLADTAINEYVKLTPDIKPGHGELNSTIPSTVKSVKNESWTENDIKSNMASGNEPLAEQKRLNSSFQNDLASIQSSTPSADGVMSGLQKVGMDVIDFLPKEHLLTENVKTNLGNKDNNSLIKTDTVVDKSSMNISDDTVSKHGSVLLETAATTEIHFNAVEPAKDAILKSYEGEPEFPVSSTVGSTILEKSQKDVDKTPDIVQGSDVIVIVKAEELESTISQTADNVPIKGAIVTDTQTQAYIGEQPRAETGEPKDWEILKSIVYGGLVESITSLGIVSSAASSGASPLSIIALGLANLVGGLFVIGHNLVELKNNHSGGDPQQTNMQEDRYQELLGRRANFLLHAVIAVISFLIFGSVPLVVYGLLIRKNYYAEVKLAAVATTSLVCIILLAIGKVYTTRPPKSYIKTVLYYVSMALAASAVSYIAGELIKDLLEKFSHSESGFVITMPSSGARKMETEWMSY